MNLPQVKVERCGCGDPHCSRYGLDFGMFYQGCGWSLDEASEIAIRLNSYEQLAQRVETLEQLRPQWAKGYTDDSIAAQAATAALSQVWKVLGVKDQTQAMIKLRDIENSVYQKVADIIRERMDKRFDEHGTRESDTNACYFSNPTHEALDEEDQDLLDIVMDQKS